MLDLWAILELLDMTTPKNQKKYISGTCPASEVPISSTHNKLRLEILGGKLSKISIQNDYEGE